MTVSVYHLLTDCYDCNVVMRMEGVESVDLSGDASCAYGSSSDICWSLVEGVSTATLIKCVHAWLVDVVHNQTL